MSAEPAVRQHPGMRQSDIRRLRRSSLLRAALETVAQHDIEGATVARICAHAGASRGLISHYFDSKEDLLLTALRGLFDDAQALKDSLAADTARSPQARIKAIAHSSFEPPVYAWEMAAAWQAFTNASRHNHAYREPIRESTRRSVATVLPLFAEIAGRSRLRIEPSAAALGLFTLIDGLWNSLATDKDGLDTRQAAALCDVYIEGCLGQSQTGDVPR